MDTDIGLTTDQLKALRNADSIVLRWHPEDCEHEPKGAMLECIKETDPGDGFGRRELPRVTIPILLPIVDNYTGPGWNHTTETKRAIAFAWWPLHARFADDPMHTFVHHLLRKGDQIQPVLTVGNRSHRMVERHINREDLAFYIRRGSKSLRIAIETALYDDVDDGLNIRLKETQP